MAAFTVVALLAAAQLVFGLQPANGDPPVRALGPTIADLAIVVLLYTLAAYRPRRVSLAGLAVCLLGAAVAVARWAPVHAAQSTSRRPKVVEKHVASIFDKLGLPPSDTDNRRVIAAIRYLES